MAVIAMVLTVFNACTKDELKTTPDEGIAKTGKADVYLENGYLAFKNMNVVDSVMNVLNSMSRQEKDVWEQKIGLKSARAEFNQIFDEYEKLTTKEEFLKFKAKYADKLKFNEMDESDCSIDYPYECSYYRSIMNNKGIFKVGLSLCQYTRENQIIVLDGDMKKLENLNAYSNDKNILVSVHLKDGGINNQTDLIADFPGFDPSNNNNRWWINGDKDRKLLNELKVAKMVSWNQPVAGGPVYTTKSCNFYLRQYGLKKGTFGWNNYSTVYELKNAVIKVQNLQTVNVTFSNGGTSPEVKPDYVWDLYFFKESMTYTWLNLNYLRPTFSFQGNVNSRGLNYGLVFIQNKEHTVFP
ncbi:MAG: DUF4848 domain-containing protein [Bacteroidota bacterium]|nr:DUF4848 domain-containing protein [Bacteroidota bacterium]